MPGREPGSHPAARFSSTVMMVLVGALALGSAQPRWPSIPPRRRHREDRAIGSRRRGCGRGSAGRRWTYPPPPRPAVYVRLPGHDADPDGRHRPDVRQPGEGGAEGGAPQADGAYAGLGEPTPGRARSDPAGLGEPGAAPPGWPVRGDRERGREQVMGAAYMSRTRARSVTGPERCQRRRREIGCDAAGVLA